MEKIRDIIERCGGPEAIADKSNGQIQARSISNWLSPSTKWGTSSGIPHKHWRYLMELDESLTTTELHEANEEARALKKSSVAA